MMTTQKRLMRVLHQVRKDFGATCEELKRQIDEIKATIYPIETNAIGPERIQGMSRKLDEISRWQETVSDAHEATKEGLEHLARRLDIAHDIPPLTAEAERKPSPQYDCPKCLYHMKLLPPTKHTREFHQCPECGGLFIP